MTTAREWQEAADEARELAEHPDTLPGRRELLHRSAMHYEVEAIKALFAERAQAEREYDR